MVDAIQEVIEAVDQRLALNEQIHDERAGGRDTMSSDDLANGLLRLLEEVATDGMPGVHDKGLGMLRGKENQIRLYTGQAEKCELS